ncbi:MAG TPA: CHASE2 domain-containing protein [Bryobacteraceae bacterium]|nr:CHASE2 domain-containing protein [Bryobacteraceae bacterium]
MAAPANPPPAATPPAPPGEKTPQKRTIAIVVAAYFVAVTALFLIENVEELARLPFGSSIARKIEHFGTLYQFQMSLVPRPLESHYVSLLDFGSGQGNCETRRRITDALPKLAAARPAMIVSDIGFANANCINEPDTTAKLVKALRDVSQTTPLVLPDPTESLIEMPDRKADEMREKGFGDDDLLAIEPVPVPDAHIAYGVIELNADRRKVPVRWGVHATPGAPLMFRESLSFAAAKLYRSNFPDKGERLDKLAAAGYHPFTSLLREADFSTVPVEHISEESSIAKLKGRIVIMGFGDDLHDLWSTYVGRLPGYVLQANYLEALLDARAYRPVSFLNQLFIGALWFGVVELPFWFHKFSDIGALLRSFALSLIIMFVLYYVLLVNFAWYVSVAPPSALAIAGRVLYQAMERKSKKGAAQEAAAPEQ